MVGAPLSPNAPFSSFPRGLSHKALLKMALSPIEFSPLSMVRYLSLTLKEKKKESERYGKIYDNPRFPSRAVEWRQRAQNT